MGGFRPTCNQISTRKRGESVVILYVMILFLSLIGSSGQQSIRDLFIIYYYLWVTNTRFDRGGRKDVLLEHCQWRYVTLVVYLLHHTILICIQDLESTIQFEQGFIATSILHPATYLNKVLVASSQGSIQLWNIHTRSALIHWFFVHSSPRKRTEPVSTSSAHTAYFHCRVHPVYLLVLFQL